MNEAHLKILGIMKDQALQDYSNELIKVTKDGRQYVKIHQALERYMEKRLEYERAKEEFERGD